MSIVLLIICALVLLYLGTSQTTAIVSLLGAGLLGVAGFYGLLAAEHHVAQLANQIFMGFLDKSQQRPQARFAAVLWIVPLASALHLPIDGFDRGVDVNPDPGILQTA